MQVILSFVIPLVSLFLILLVIVSQLNLLVKLRDCQQKTFRFLNRLCLLISNPLPPLINIQPWCLMIQHTYFILILALVAYTYTIHTCIYIVFIYLFYTYFILAYYTSLLNYTLIKIHMIQPPILQLLCFHLIVCMTVNLSRYHTFCLSRLK